MNSGNTERVHTPFSLCNEMISKSEAIRGIIDVSHANYCWDRIYKKSLFNSIKFAEDYIIAEDIATIYKLTLAANKFYYSKHPAYHHRIDNLNSLSHGYTAKKVYDVYRAFYGMYSQFQNSYPEYLPELYFRLLRSAVFYFVYYKMRNKDIKRWLKEIISMENIELKHNYKKYGTKKTQYLRLCYYIGRLCPYLIKVPYRIAAKFSKKIPLWFNVQTKPWPW